MELYPMSGKICMIYETEQKTDKFRKREFVLEKTSHGNKGVYVNYVKIQAVQDKCELLDEVDPGDNVSVKFEIDGRKFGLKGEEKYFTNLNLVELSILNKTDLFIDDKTDVGNVLPMGDGEEIKDNVDPFADIMKSKEGLKENAYDPGDLPF
jgi:hypothetical protein